MAEGGKNIITSFLLKFFASKTFLPYKDLCFASKVAVVNFKVMPKKNELNDSFAYTSITFLYVNKVLKSKKTSAAWQNIKKYIY